MDVFTQILLGGRRKGPRGSPGAMQTILGWVLCADVSPRRDSQQQVTVYHAAIESEDDIIRKF